MYQHVPYVLLYLHATSITQVYTQHMSCAFNGRFQLGVGAGVGVGGGSVE